MHEALGFLSRSIAALFVTLVLLFVPHANAASLDCGQPQSSGERPTASDALFVLRAAVGATPCSLFLCDVDSNCGVYASDALIVLKNAIGQDIGLVCGLDCSIGATITEAEVDIDLQDTDTIRIAGTFNEFPVKNREGFIVHVEHVEYGVETEDLMESADGNVLSYSAPGGIGITDAHIDLAAGTFEILLEQVFLASLPNPFRLEFEFEDTSECRMVQLRDDGNAEDGVTARMMRIAPGAPQAMPCVFGEPYADPPNLVEEVVQSGAGVSSGELGESTDVELTVVLDGVDPVENSVEVRRVLPDGSIDATPLCTMTENTSFAPPAGARAFTCTTPLVIRDSTSGELVRHELVHVAVSAGTGRAEVPAGTQVVSRSLEVSGVPKLGSPGAGDLVSTIRAASDLWDANLAIAPTQAEAEVAAMKAIRNVPEIRSASLTPDSIVMQTDTGVLCAIQVHERACGPEGGACKMRCGGAANEAGLGGNLARSRERAHALLEREPSVKPSERSLRRVADLDSEQEPVVVTNHEIVLWDTNYFFDFPQSFPDGPAWLLDPSVANRSVKADRVLLRELTSKTQCPKFKLTEFVGSEVATIEAIRANATKGGMLVIITHGYGDKASEGIPNAFATQEHVDAQTQVTYAEDLQALRLVVIAAHDDVFGLTPRFFASIPGSFADTIVWAGACQSGRNYYPRLSDAFLAKGASTYYGFSNFVADLYGRLAGEFAFNRLIAESGTTDEAFADVSPKVDPVLQRSAKPEEIFRRFRLKERSQARFLMERPMEAAFIGKAKLKPTAPALAHDEQVVLTVELEGTEDCEDLVYRWTNTATVGSLTGSGGTESFDSDLPSAIYTADSAGVGSDTVNVQILVVEEGQERILGESKAILGVANYCISCSVGADPSITTGGLDCPIPTETCCTDGADNDNDGDVDCDDGDCEDAEDCEVDPCIQCLDESGRPVSARPGMCPEPLEACCRDGVDNDGDGDTDCDDSDCESKLICSVDLGLKPIPCEPEGCYGPDYGPNYLNNTFNGHASIEPDVVRVGDVLTATAFAYNAAYGVSWPNLGEQIGECTPSDTTCSWRMLSATNRWVIANFGIGGYFGSGSEQVAYAVVP